MVTCSVGHAIITSHMPIQMQGSVLFVMERSMKLTLFQFMTDASGNCDLESNVAGLKVPPRPVAPRIKSFRERLEAVETYVL